jgi:hypothetical protein
MREIIQSILDLNIESCHDPKNVGQLQKLRNKKTDSPIWPPKRNAAVTTL